jgi:hypothetical protein
MASEWGFQFLIFGSAQLVENAAKKLQSSTCPGVRRLSKTHKPLQSFQNPPAFPPKQRGAAFSHPLKVQPDAPMSDLFVAAKAVDVLASESRARDQFWIDACRRNNVDFAQLQPRLGPESPMERSTAWPSRPDPTKPNGQAKHTTGPGGSPGSSISPEKSRAWNPQPTADAYSVDKAQQTAALKRAAQQGGMPAWPSGASVCPSTTQIDKSRDPRLNRAVSDAFPVRSRRLGAQ